MLLILIGALMIGLSLGLLGSGGSILTVPLLIFVLHRPEKLAIAESLAIVGTLALMGSLSYIKRSCIDWKSVGIFGLSGLAGSYVGACLSHYLPGHVQLVMFGLIMLIAAGMMLKENRQMKQEAKHPRWLEGLVGVGIGLLTGCLGIGGGFLIVPVLVLFFHLPMQTAIGTSLIVIAMNAWIGFFEQLWSLNQVGLQVSWSVIMAFSAIGMCGSLIGSFLSKVIPQGKLKRIFGLLMIPMGLYTIWFHL